MLRHSFPIDFPSKITWKLMLMWKLKIDLLRAGTGFWKWSCIS